MTDLDNDPDFIEWERQMLEEALADWNPDEDIEVTPENALQQLRELTSD